MRKINEAGLNLVKEFEGFKAEAYKDPVGVWTIGYGTTSRAGLGIAPRPGMVISRDEAERYLEMGLDQFGKKIEPFIKAEINENEWAAFLSLAYNIGPSAFKRSSALRHFNAGDKQKAADAIRLWKKAGGKVLRGLVRRREAERTLFLTPVAEPVSTPTAQLPIEKQLEKKMIDGTGSLAFWTRIGIIALSGGMAANSGISFWNPEAQAIQIGVDQFEYLFGAICAALGWKGMHSASKANGGVL